MTSRIRKPRRRPARRAPTVQGQALDAFRRRLWAKALKGDDGAHRAHTQLKRERS